MKIIFAFAILLLASCATVSPDIAGDTYQPGDTLEVEKVINEVSSYKVGDFDIHITDWEGVNAQYQKVCSSTCNRTVKGFVNFTAKEMWSTSSIPTIIHEFKHIAEGRFHH